MSDAFAAFGALAAEARELNLAITPPELIFVGPRGSQKSLLLGNLIHNVCVPTGARAGDAGAAAGAEAAAAAAAAAAAVTRRHVHLQLRYAADAEDARATVKKDAASEHSTDVFVERLDDVRCYCDCRGSCAIWGARERACGIVWRRRRQRRRRRRVAAVAARCTPHRARQCVRVYVCL